MTQCFYCKNLDNDNYCNKCTPGCIHNYIDSKTPPKPSCPQHEPKCNVTMHECDAEPGHTLLTKIVVTTTDCQNCDPDGSSAVFTLTGDTTGSSSQKQCKTGTDFEWTAGLQANYTAGDRSEMKVFDESCNEPDSKKDRENGWGTCGCHALDGLVTKLEASWKGPGTWTPDTVCFDWHKRSQYVTLCTYNDSTSSSSVHQFDCKRLDNVECP